MKKYNSIKLFIKQFLPPIFVRFISYLLSFTRKKRENLPDWEYLPQGWLTQDSKIKGWNVESIAETQKAHWPIFLEKLKGTTPLDVQHEMIGLVGKDYQDYGGHNTLMSYAYALTLASRKKDNLKMLDWGGGIGHYYPISKAILPDVRIEYHCYDTPVLCQIGRELLPEGNFYENIDEVFNDKYDFVLASSSLQYFKNWKEIIRKLRKSCINFLYITCLPVVLKTNPFVIVQRPYCHGYFTEYKSWVFNRLQFLETVEQEGIKLIREFLIQEHPFVKGAPEQGEFRGFLFQNDQIKQ
jgi:putative methyltransferase (TIGR04325 family)